jgi:hypothetical protein
LLAHWSHTDQRAEQRVQPLLDRTWAGFHAMRISNALACPMPVNPLAVILAAMYLPSVMVPQIGGMAHL